MSGPLTLARALYLLFAVAAGGRSLVQWLDAPGRAPLAYALSTLAFCCYLAGYVATSPRRAGRRRRLIGVLAGIELAGVLVVGTLSLAAPGLLADTTVWSAYGAGYAFVPLLIPVVLLGWLHRSRVAPSAAPALARSA
ncbi:hypothetical protein [Nocardioides albidus]|uniref:hypothetical protein n=1 Tax=Nocardioides albidus TaxID=1517589 RepID=UPI0018650B5B|nr:hypothetical protein [Nocardioides albidus]